MSYLLFIDESGHDHKNTPYEVRGGILLHARTVWPFVRAVKALEVSCYGDALYKYGTEIKGHKLLDKDRFKWAHQDKWLDDASRRKHALSFLRKGLQKAPPSRIEFTAYGQSSLSMARGIFQLLQDHEAVLFAAAIPADVQKPPTYQAEEFLRKDHVFLLERLFYFLEWKREQGLLVMDETEKTEDRDFVRRLERYFTQTQTGRYRTEWIVPTPFFVSSDMTYPVQAADVCIYCLNWGFRLPVYGIKAPTREEIAQEFGPWLNRLQFKGEGYKEGEVFPTYGIVFVPDPYTGR